jgi:hypothetical protein
MINAGKNTQKSCGTHG